MFFSFFYGFLKAVRGLRYLPTKSGGVFIGKVRLPLKVLGLLRQLMEIRLVFASRQYVSQQKITRCKRNNYLIFLQEILFFLLSKRCKQKIFV